MQRPREDSDGTHTLDSAPADSSAPTESSTHRGGDHSRGFHLLPKPPAPLTCHPPGHLPTADPEGPPSSTPRRVQALCSLHWVLASNVCQESSHSKATVCVKQTGETRPVCSWPPLPLGPALGLPQSKKRVPEPVREVSPGDRGGGGGRAERGESTEGHDSRRGATVRLTPQPNSGVRRTS